MFSSTGSTQENPMAALCKMIVDTKYDDLPKKVVQYAKRSILDTMGVIIGGSAMEGIPAVVDLVKEKGGKPEAAIPFYGGRVPASEAALAIGPMARAMDLGDMHGEAGHTSEYTVPVLLASGVKASGKDFITAYVVGQEVLVRIGMAYRALSRGIPSGSGGGGHYVFGAVAAAGKMLGLPQEELENAQGIASTMTQPHIRGISNPATLMIRIHHGFVCQDAINACLLARKGITGPRRESLAAPAGYLGMARWETDPAALTKGLGKEWEMLGTMMKRHAANYPTHTSIEGILSLMKEHDFTANDIAGIEIILPTTSYAILTFAKELKWNPQSVPECQFSLPYIVATAAYDGFIFLESYSTQAMARKDVRELMERISATEDSSLPMWSARVNATLKNGRKYSKETLYPRGHPASPLTVQELADKFKRCVPYSAFKLSDAVVDTMIKDILDLENVGDVMHSLIVPLTPKP